MINKYPFPNYVYLSSKPIKNQGDTSIDSDSFKEIEEEIESKKCSLIDKNKLNIPRESKKPIPRMTKKKGEINSKKNLKSTPHSSTKYTEKKSFFNTEKENSFNIANKIHIQKENNRYNNYYEKEIKNNLRFLSCLKDEESDYSEGIINNEISVNFINGFNSKIKSKKVIDKQVEIPLDNLNFSRINTNSEISNDNINRLMFSKTNKSLKKDKNDIYSMKKSKKDADNDKFEQEDKENYTPNKQYDKEVKIDLKEVNKNNNTNNNNLIDKSKSIKNYVININNNKYIEIKRSQTSLGNRVLNSQKNSFLSLNKKYKIFHKFLSIGIDTSGLNTLDDDMNDFILNPKINYNFPFNNLENELE